jgi:RNA polymerase sigma-70 factor (ECF subfamily)
MPDFVQELESQIPRLRRYARALARDPAWADDLVQDTLERALRQRWRFRFNSNLTAWLFTILYRLYLNDAARAFRILSAPEDEALPAALVEDSGLRLDVERALSSLTIEHRAVIVLIALEQLTYKEAADVLNVPLGTVMSRLARARELLRRFFSDPAARAVDAPLAPAGDAGAHLTRIK